MKKVRYLPSIWLKCKLVSILDKQEMLLKFVTLLKHVHTNGLPFLINLSVARVNFFESHYPYSLCAMYPRVCSSSPARQRFLLWF